MRTRLGGFPAPLPSPPIPKEAPEVVCSGCLVNGECLPFGTRLVRNGNKLYCDITKQLLPQKELEVDCQNNYECLTNQCSEDKCVSIIGELRETRGFLQRIMNFLSRIFG